MFLQELFIPVSVSCNLYENVFALPRTGAPRRVFMTKQFRKDMSDLANWNQGDISAAFLDFIAFKIREGAKQYTKKDNGFRAIPAMHCHLIHGLILIIYNINETHIELYRLIKHDQLENAQDTAALRNYINRLDEDDFSEWNLPVEENEEVFGSDDFSGMQEMIYSLLDNDEDRALLKQYAETGNGYFKEIVAGYAAERAEGIPADVAEKEFLSAWEKQFKKSLKASIEQAL